MLEKFFHAFPGMKIEFLQCLGDGKHYSIHWRATGIHKGMIMNIPPTGKEIDITGVSLLEVHQQKIYRGKHLWDLAALLRCIGILPQLA